MSNPTMTNYTNCLTLEQMEYLDLFDNIPYKDVKKLVKLDDETDFEVEIKDLPNDSGYMCSTSFTFKLEIDISQGSLPLMVEKEYCVIKEYNGSSPMAMYIGENLVYPEEEEDIVFHCESCKKAIVRDSEDHDFSKCDMEDKWYCVDCPCEEEEEEEEKGCMKCGSAPRHNQTDEDGSYLCLHCEEIVKKEEEEEKGCVKCYTCDEAEATHKVFRDALGEYEHTCDKCFKKEYEEEEEEE
jgi:hypothetical protein